MKVLTIFFSMKGENIAPGMKIVNLKKGYTNCAAELIQQVTGGDLFEIKPVRVYNPDHMKMIYEAKEEFDRNERPAIKAYPESIDGYDVIFLCFPNWWATMPMPVFTFLDQYDWNGKVIAPLVTSGGSGFANALDDLEKECPGAVILEGMEVLGHEVNDSVKKIQNWAWKTVQTEGLKKPVNEFREFSWETSYEFLQAVRTIAKEKYGRPVKVRVTYDDVIICQFIDGTAAGIEFLDRKEKTVKTTGKPSIELYWHAQEYPELAQDETLAPFGGAVPYLVNGENHGAFIVSGLRHREDHDLLMEALERVEAGR